MPSERDCMGENRKNRLFVPSKCAALQVIGTRTPGLHGKLSSFQCSLDLSCCCGWVPRTSKFRDMQRTAHFTEFRTPRRMPFGDTAGCQPALQRGDWAGLLFLLKLR